MPIDEWMNGWNSRMSRERTTESKTRGHKINSRFHTTGFEGREMDECYFRYDDDRGRITEDRSRQNDEKTDGKLEGGC